MKILLAVDESAIGAAAVRHVARLAKALKATPQLYVLNVVPRLSKAAEKEFGKAGPDRYYQAQFEAALAPLRPLLKRTRLPFFVLQGNICALMGTRDHLDVMVYDPIAPDPSGMINQGHGNATARAIQLYAGDELDEAALIELAGMIAGGMA